MTGTKKYLTGTAFITTKISLDQLAKSISTVLSIRLEKAPVGRFEEYMGYEGEAMGLTMRLLDIGPSRSSIDEHTYQLDVTPGRGIFNDPQMPFKEVDISDHLQLVLSRIPGLAVSTE